MGLSVTSRFLFIVKDRAYRRFLIVKSGLYVISEELSYLLERSVLSLLQQRPKNGEANDPDAVHL